MTANSPTLQLWRRVIALALLVLSSAAHAQELQNRPGHSQILKKVSDIPMPGSAVRFDYQSLDIEHERLYISHMNSDQLIVFDTQKQQVVANLDGFKRIHGVLVVPELDRLYASVTGEHKVAVADTKTLKVLSFAGPIAYPDGLAYSPTTKRIFVSDEHGEADAVIDTTNNELLTNIKLGGVAGNTVYDPRSGHILVAVHGKNDLVSINPASMKIVGRFPLPGLEDPHGIALNVADRLAFIAGEESHSVGVFDLKAMRLISVLQVGEDPDVLAFDPGLKRLYVSSESGTVTVFQQEDHGLHALGMFNMPHAHTVLVDPNTHLIYFPLENIGGHPILRIMKPADLP